MGYGVAMPKQCYTHLSAEDREPGPGPRPFVEDNGVDVGRAPSTMSRELIRHALQGSYRSCRARHRQPPEPISHGDRGNLRTSGWAARPTRLPGVSDARILTTRGSISRQRPSMWRCMCYHAEPCVASCWRRYTGAHGASASGTRDRPTRSAPPHDADCRAPRLRWPPARCPATGKATSSRGLAMARLSVP